MNLYIYWQLKSTLKQWSYWELLNTISMTVNSVGSTCICRSSKPVQAFSVGSTQGKLGKVVSLEMRHPTWL